MIQMVLPKLSHHYRHSFCSSRTVRDLSISSFWSQSFVPLTVLDGHTTFGIDWNGKRVIAVGIAARWRRGRKKEVNRWGIVIVFIVVDLGKMLKLNLLILVKIYGLNRLSRGHLLGVNLEINRVHVLKTVRLCSLCSVNF
jgi:hypothetical protein